MFPVHISCKLHKNTNTPLEYAQHTKTWYDSMNSVATTKPTYLYKQFGRWNACTDPCYTYLRINTERSFDWLYSRLRNSKYNEKYHEKYFITYGLSEKIWKSLILLFLSRFWNEKQSLWAQRIGTFDVLFFIVSKKNEKNTRRTNK